MLLPCTSEIAMLPPVPEYMTWDPPGDHPKNAAFACPSCVLLADARSSRKRFWSWRETALEASGASERVVTAPVLGRAAFPPGPSEARAATAHARPPTPLSFTQPNPKRA